MAEFEAPAASLWAWVRDFQLPTADPSVSGTDSLWVNFFEDRTQVSTGACCGAKGGHRRLGGAAINFLLQTNETNRNSWSALELARYLIESRNTGLDKDWAAHVDSLLHYALTLFSAQVLLSTCHWTCTWIINPPRPSPNFPCRVVSVTLRSWASRQVAKRLTSEPAAILPFASQDDDRKPWGGASSKLGAVASLYACAGGPAWYRSMGLRNAGVCGV